MRSFRARCGGSVLFMVALAHVASAAGWPTGEVVLKTRDGKQRVGQILSETAVGYLFRTATDTQVIAFGEIDGFYPVNTNAPAAAPAAPVPSSPPLVAAQREAPEATSPVQPWLEHRDGFHFGVGAALGGLAAPVAFTSRLTTWVVAAGRVPMEWGISRAGIRVTPWLGMVRLDSARGFNSEMLALFGVDAQLRLYATRSISFGFGLFQSVLSTSPVVYSAGPSVSALHYRFGREFAHSIELWACVNFSPGPQGAVLSLPLVTAAYGYMF